jgi:excisionase family DNA binding protein
MTDALCVDVAGAARLLGVGKSSVRRWIESGALPIIKFPSEKFDGETSRRILIAVCDLELFIAKHRTDVAR